jgi:hypothetical protein
MIFVTPDAAKSVGGCHRFAEQKARAGHCSPRPNLSDNQGDMQPYLPKNQWRESISDG